jgi:uncharacterized membrane protein YcaP (DUF421 family)
VEIIVRASVIFAVLLVLTRGMKRRSLADMAPFELLLLVTLGDIIQQGITQEDYSITGAVLAVSTFAFWITVVTYVTWRWRPAARIIDGVPLVIVQDGTLIESTLKAERLPVAEVLEAARQNGIDSLEKVRLAILETTGRISFIEHDETQSLRRRPGWPAMGSGPADTLPVRLDPELRTAVEDRAQADRTTASDIVRTALRQYLRVG